MTVITRKTYENPSEGVHTAIFAAEHDEGQHNYGRFGSKDSVRLTFYITDEVDSNGEPMRIAISCPKTLGPKSKLLSFVSVFAGAAGVPAGRVELADYIGANCRLEIKHNVKPTGTFANIDAVLPSAPGAPHRVIPPKYQLQPTKVVAPPPPQPVPSGVSPAFAETWLGKQFAAASAASTTATAPTDDLRANIAAVRRKKGQVPFETEDAGPVTVQADQTEEVGNIPF